GGGGGGGGRGGAPAEPARLERGARGVAERRLDAGPPPEREARSGVRLDGQRDVVEGREVAEDARHLERARQASSRAVRRVQPRDVVIGEPDRARVGSKVARELAD